MVELSIVIPAYNEEHRIEGTLNYYLNFFNKNYGKNFEIIVVPNNCSDKTPLIVSRLAKKHKQIRIKEIKHYVGKAGAVIEGFKIGKGNLVGFTDADNSAPPESFYKLVKKINGYDGAIGSRWVKDSEITLKQPLMRRFFSRSFNFIVRFFLMLNYYDTQCGSKVFKKEYLEKIMPYLGKTQWAFDIDILYQLKRNKAKICEVPIKWKDDARTHLDLKKAPLQMFLAIIRLRLIYSPLKFLIKFYDLVPKK